MSFLPEKQKCIARKCQDHVWFYRVHAKSVSLWELCWHPVMTGVILQSRCNVTSWLRPAFSIISKWARPGIESRPSCPDAVVSQVGSEGRLTNQSNDQSTKQTTSQPTVYISRRPSSEAKISSATQTFPSLYGAQKSIDVVNTSQPLVPILIVIISNLSNDRSKASSKTIPPHSAI